MCYGAQLVRFRYRSVHDIAIFYFAPPLPGAGCGLSSAPFILPAVWRKRRLSDRIHLGCIGLGVQGRGLMGRIPGAKEVQVVAVCDVDTNRREDGRNGLRRITSKMTATGPFEGCAAFEDFRELLARPDINAVVIATPDHWHALIAIAAAEREGHLLRSRCANPFTSRAQ